MIRSRGSWDIDGKEAEVDAYLRGGLAVIRLLVTVSYSSVCTIQYCGA